MMGFLSRSVFLRFTERGVVSVNRVVNEDALDLTVTEYWPGCAFGRMVTKRLWSRSPWWPEFAALLNLSAPTASPADDREDGQDA